VRPSPVTKGENTMKNNDLKSENVESVGKNNKYLENNNYSIMELVKISEKKFPPINSKKGGTNEQKGGQEIKQLNKAPSLNKPWLNTDGTYKNDEELKIISKDWSAKTWEVYLDSLESRRTETLLPEPNSMDDFSDEQCFKQVISFLSDRNYPNVRRAILIALGYLSRRERQVLVKKYWENKGYKTISKELGITKDSARVYIDRGLKKMKSLLLKGIFKNEVTLSKLITEAEKETNL